MLSFLDPFRGLSLTSLAVRMLLAVFCGSVIGIEREFKRRPAGFRTHILICMGAAITLVMNYPTDIARLGAQVVAGIGFIGAGTIVVTKHQRVKGLTTAAGLWTVAIVGLCIGAGFYEGAILATFLVLFAELLLSKLEYFITRNSPEVNILLEYTERPCLDDLLVLLRSNNIKLLHLEITRSTRNEKRNACAIFSLRLHKKCPLEKLLDLINETEGVISVEEI